ncbi:MAG: AmmeMemoRadiSam system protein B [Candidatus Marinimicrobia bacterium]|nr:AmmeMemoRadiSam system protein B [Candidatus Neomarinimicrobiota bacterium]MCF7850243.1 AmmeMemoRadiSam system protein B [Candidatus Neomarinimicrobiota bacterium]MCF7903715.1 AmmeMemoRadiSam system protein B [Candidatus Neomarinimicrobiota bacterium]
MSHYSNTRPPAVAGMFYPGTAAEIRQRIDSFLADIPAVQGQAPKAIIVPHAGYIYSGIVAATAYDTLQAVAAQIKTVILLGPSHRIPLQGLALPTVEIFQTPLGDIDLDTKTIYKLVKDFKQVQLSDRAHEEEHALEVQLPFLQTVLENFELIPIVVGDASETEVSEVLESCWGGEETLVVISSDLSHFYSYEKAKRLDEETAELIEAFRGEALPEHSACGRIPIRGMLHLAQKRGMSIKRFDLRNSGDTAGSHDQVVGYGAWGLIEP